MIQKKSRFNRNKLALSVAALTLSGAVLAGDLFKINIEKQNAGTALLKLSEKSGVQILMSKELGDNIQLPAIKGEYTVESALASMLKGTGLTFEYASENSIVIQKEDSQPEVSDKKEVEEVVVTGSRLKNSNPTSPVVSINRDQIDNRGFSTAEDIIRSLPQNYSSMNMARSVSQPVGGDGIPVGSVAQGESSANLRGLGTGATLVLINGRRTSGSAAFKGAQVNLSNIPAAAIERVEVMLDGAAAVYGSDAIAGVINFILRKEYSGATTTIHYENGVNGGNKYALDQLFGINWETGNLTASMSLSQTTPILTSKTGYTSNDYRNRGGPDLRNSTFTQPGNVSGFGALALDNDGTNWTLADLSMDNIESAKGDLIPKTQTSDTDSKSLSLSLEQEIWENAKGFGEILYTKNNTQSLGQGPIAFGFVPASNPFNQAGFPLLVFSYHGTEAEAGLIPFSRTEANSDNLTINAGFTSDIGFKDWEVNVSGSYSTSKTEATSFAYDSTFSSNPDFTEHYNPFGNGSVQDTDAFLAAYQAGTPRITKSRLASLNGFVEGSIMELDSGDWRLVMGGEYRLETLSQGSDALAIRDLADTGPSQTVEALFLESSLPITSSLSATLQGRWEQYTFDSDADPMDTSGVKIDGISYEKFSPRIGLLWNATDELKLRASWGESFKAPNLTQVVSSTSEGTFPSNTYDPIEDEIVAIFFDGRGNPKLQPETGETITFGLDWTPEFIDGLNISLNYNKTKFDSRIEANPGFNFGEEFILANPDLFPGFAKRNPDTNQLERIELRPINIAQRDNESIDFSVQYAWSNNWGDFDASLGGVYTSKQEDLIAPGQEKIGLDGTTGGPDKVTANLSLNWTKDAYGANLYGNYHHHYQNTEATGPSFIATIPEPPRIGHYITWDLTGFYKDANSGWTFRVGARNLLNNKFPFHISFAGPYDTVRVDLRGRVIFAEVKKNFNF
ncbi:TonB-dependent receptor [Porticoccaceae bacterium LTM1]|nr:TonB-dependent receptor [Porticoccaceae bacterium LTM1]